LLKVYFDEKKIAGAGSAGGPDQAEVPAFGLFRGLRGRRCGVGSGVG